MSVAGSSPVKLEVTYAFRKEDLTGESYFFISIGKETARVGVTGAKIIVKELCWMIKMTEEMEKVEASNKLDKTQTYDVYFEPKN